MYSINFKEIVLRWYFENFKWYWLKNLILKINGILLYMMDCFDFINLLVIMYKVNLGICDNYKEDDIIMIMIIII